MPARSRRSVVVVVPTVRGARVDGTVARVPVPAVVAVVVVVARSVVVMVVVGAVCAVPVRVESHLPHVPVDVVRARLQTHAVLPLRPSGLAPCPARPSLACGRTLAW